MGDVVERVIDAVECREEEKNDPPGADGGGAKEPEIGDGDDGCGDDDALGAVAHRGALREEVKRHIDYVEGDVIPDDGGDVVAELEQEDRHENGDERARHGVEPDGELEVPEVAVDRFGERVVVVKVEKPHGFYCFHAFIRSRSSCVSKGFTR